MTSLIWYVQGAIMMLRVLEEVFYFLVEFNDCPMIRNSHLPLIEGPRTCSSSDERLWRNCFCFAIGIILNRLAMTYHTHGLLCLSTLVREASFYSGWLTQTLAIGCAAENKRWQNAHLGPSRTSVPAAPCWGSWMEGEGVKDCERQRY